MAKVENTPGAPTTQLPDAAPAGKEKGRALLYPLPPAKVLSVDQFFEYWHSVPVAASAQLMMYVYRHKPVIQKPKPIFIGKYATPIPKEHIARIHGWGHYGFSLTDNSRKSGEVCTARWQMSEIEFPWDQFPPDCADSPSDLVMDHADNQVYIRWMRAKGMLPMQGNGTQTQSAGGDAAVGALAVAFKELLAELRSKREQGGGGIDTTLTKINELYASTSKGLMDMVMGQVKGNSTADFLELMLTFQKLNAGSDRSAPDPRINLFIEELKGMRAELATERQRGDRLMERLLDRQQERPAEDPISKRVVDAAITRLLEGGDGGGGPRRSKWGEVIELASPHLDKAFDALGLFGRGFANMWAARARQAGVSPMRPNPPQNTAPPAAGLPAAENGPSAQPADSPAVEDAMTERLLNFFATHWPTIIKFIEEDKPGEALADYLMFGGQLKPMVLGILRDEIGRDKIMQMLRNSEAWQLVAPVEGPFVKLLDGFLAWHDGWDDEEPPPSPPVSIDEGRRS